MQVETCEICQKQFIAGYGYSLAINWLVTGHAYVKAYLCSETNGTGQHWGCSPEHAIEAIQRCLNEHMHVQNLKERHAATGKPRYLPEHELWAKPQGEMFHLVEVRGKDGNIINKL